MDQSNVRQDFAKKELLEGDIDYITRGNNYIKCKVVHLWHEALDHCHLEHVHASQPYASPS